MLNARAPAAETLDEHKLATSCSALRAKIPDARR